MSHSELHEQENKKVPLNLLMFNYIFRDQSMRTDLTLCVFILHANPSTIGKKLQSIIKFSCLRFVVNVTLTSAIWPNIHVLLYACILSGKTQLKVIKNQRNKKYIKPCKTHLKNQRRFWRIVYNHYKWINLNWRVFTFLLWYMSWQSGNTR